MRLALLSFLAIFLLSLTLAACGGPKNPPTAGRTAATDTPATARPTPPETKPVLTATWRGTGTHLEFTAWGMTCSGCEQTVQTRVGRIPGVETVKADLSTGTVRVELSEGAEREAVTAQITSALEQPASGRKYEILRAAHRDGRTQRPPLPATADPDDSRSR